MTIPQATGRMKRTGEQYQADVNSSQTAYDIAVADVTQLESLLKVAEAGTNDPGDKSIEELSDAFTMVQVAAVKLQPARNNLEHTKSILEFSQARLNRWNKKVLQHQRTVDLLSSEIEVLRAHVKYHRAALDGSNKGESKPKLGVLLEALELARNGGYNR